MCVFTNHSSISFHRRDPLDGELSVCAKFYLQLAFLPCIVREDDSGVMVASLLYLSLRQDFCNFEINVSFLGSVRLPSHAFILPIET